MFNLIKCLMTDLY